MKYITKDELKELAVAVEFFAERLCHDLYYDATVSDVNGEALGRITITEAGEYGFIPFDEKDVNAELD